MFKHIFAGIVSAAVAGGAWGADNYPSRPIRIVVPGPAGGAVDMVGRTVAQGMSERLGVPVVVENKAGANTAVAAESVGNANPDGYTLLLGPEVIFVVNPIIYAKLGYDPVKSFTPITNLVEVNQALIVNAATPIDDMKSFLEYGRTNPGKLNYGTFGAGSTAHLNMVLLEGATSSRYTAIHYKGGAPALTDLLGGHIQAMFVSMGPAVPLAQKKQVKVIAVGSERPVAALPGVPTLAASINLPGFRAMSWFGLFGPAGLAPEIVAKLNGAAHAALADPKIRTVLEREYYDPVPGTPQDLQQRIAADRPKWQKVIQDAGLKAD